MQGLEDASLDEVINLGDTSTANLFATSLTDINVSPPAEGVVQLPPLKSTEKNYVHVRTEKDRQRDRERGRHKSRNASMAKELAKYSLDSAQGVRNYFSEQASKKGQLEDQARSLTADLVAEKERADKAEKDLLLLQRKRAKTSAQSVAREMQVERDGYLGQIAKLDADIRELRDIAVAVQMCNADKEKTSSKLSNTATRKLKNQQRKAETATEDKNTAEATAANLAGDLKAERLSKVCLSTLAA